MFFFEITHGQVRNQPVREALDHIGWLDDMWNRVPTSMSGAKGKPAVTNSLEPAIIHLAGVSRDLSLSAMKSLSFATGALACRKPDM